MTENQNNKNIRIAFFGTPEITISILNGLKDANMLPVIIVTGEDKPIGRKQIITPTPTKIWAIKNNIPILQPKKLDADFLMEFKSLNIDISVVVAYGKIMPEELINSPVFGTINLHYSLLPKYRGASPVETAILLGKKETGITIQKMQFKLDSGPIMASLNVPIGQNETTPDLRDRLNKLAVPIVIDMITKLANNSAVFREQDETKATFSKKIKKEDGLINLLDDPQMNYDKYRAYFGWPGTYFFVEKNNKKMRILIKNAKLINNNFIITRVLPEGKKEMNYSDFTSQLLK